MKRDELKASFQNPGIDYRSVPFWAWNDELKQDELDRQIEGFQAQGMGGFMMHVREGLETPYLSETFMDRVKGSVAKAKATGIKAWLYDEDRYSSGMGGGMVPRLGGDAVRAKALVLHICREYRLGADLRFVYRAVINGNHLHSLIQLSLDEQSEPLHEGNEIYLVFEQRIAAKNDWCHGDTYTDLMNPETTRLFIETNYEPYRRAVGEEFGTTIPGIFTDEPTVKGFSERLTNTELTWMAWSEVMEQSFEQRRGYPIGQLLPYLFFQGESAAQIRHDYWLTITETFSESFTKQIGDWCTEQGIQFTGHFHSESSLIGSTLNSGAVMPHYRYLDIPGVDTLCEQTNEHLTMKQVSSVANQLGKKRVITETYGVTGWDLTFETRRWIGDWQFALGVNVLTHHLSWYSLRGCRKRDYPPSFNYHTNWWEYNRGMEDYYARLSAVLSEGRLTRNVLVIHPATSVWTRLGHDVKIEAWKNSGGNEQELQNYDREFNAFVNRLVELHYDYDLGDELIMKDFGKVVGDSIVVGDCGYSYVVLPSLMNLLSSTVELLLAFMDIGGKVVSYREQPSLIDGKKSDKLARLLRHEQFTKVADLKELERLLSNETKRSIRIQEQLGSEATTFIHMHRTFEEQSIAFIVNNDRERGFEVQIELEGGSYLQEWDAWTGKVKTIKTDATEHGVSFRASFGPADSKLYILYTEQPEEDAGQIKALPVGKSEIHLEQMGFERTTPNVLILDQCQYRFGDEHWSETMEVWRAQRLIREKLGMRQVFHSGNLQRYFWIHEPHPGNGTPVSLRFTFFVTDLPSNDVFFVFEDAERFSFNLNGNEVRIEPEGYYLDVSMKKLRLPALLEGVNTIDVQISYQNDMELENGYLIGDFAVQERRKLIKEPLKLVYGDWRSQGYPYYCGSMKYLYEIECQPEHHTGNRLELGHYEAVLLDVKVNETEGKTIPWRGEAFVELDNILNPGLNAIVIEVVGSPRNLFGPLHQADSQPSWMDWWSFHPEEGDYTPEYRGKPYGLMETPKLKYDLKKSLGE
ncbi:glycosyl hydrolase [Paenibacillus luteus]|uniref:glycosyl hydrolase n=1 Tax=Paenibacillus luteus TaxID=2545753 RepID=UPI00114290C9|nr:glycosyl hydrolase [Paenibacillus luteus]